MERAYEVAAGGAEAFSAARCSASRASAARRSDARTMWDSSTEVETEAREDETRRGGGDARWACSWRVFVRSIMATRVATGVDTAGDG